MNSLSVDNPLRSVTLELYQLQSKIAEKEERELESEDRELIMAIAPLFQQQLEAATQQGLQQGIQQGIQQGRQEGRQEGIQEGRQEGIQEGRQEGQRLIIENFLRVRFGELDTILTAFLQPISALPSAEFTLLLLQLSTLAVDEEGMIQAKQLLAENVLRMRFGEIEDTPDTKGSDSSDATLRDRFNSLVTNLLALSVEDLTSLLQQLPQLSDEELLVRLSNPTH